METSKSCLFSFATVFCWRVGYSNVLPGKMIACVSGSPQFSLNKRPFMFEQVSIIY